MCATLVTYRLGEQGNENEPWDMDMPLDYSLRKVEQQLPVRRRATMEVADKVVTMKNGPEVSEAVESRVVG